MRKVVLIINKRRERALLLENVVEWLAGAVVFGIKRPLLFPLSGRPAFWRFLGPQVKIAFVRKGRVEEVQILNNRFKQVKPKAAIDFAVECALDFPIKEGDAVCFI